MGCRAETFPREQEAKAPWEPLAGAPLQFSLQPGEDLGCRTGILSGPKLWESWFSGRQDVSPPAWPLAFRAQPWGNLPAWPISTSAKSGLSSPSWTVLYSLAGSLAGNLSW